MNMFLWILQIAVSIKCIITSFSHAFKYAGMYSRPAMIIVSIVLFLCAAGLIIPGAFKIITWLTTVTAVILAILMIIALVLHLKCPEHTATYADIVIFVIAVFIAVGRKFIAPL